MVEDLLCYSNKIESFSLRKCPYDHWLTNKEHLSTITVTNISQSFYLQDGDKNQLAKTWNIITSLSPCVLARYLLFDQSKNFLVSVSFDSSLYCIFLVSLMFKISWHIFLSFIFYVPSFYLHIQLCIFIIYLAVRLLSYKCVQSNFCLSHFVLCDVCYSIAVSTDSAVRKSKAK